MTFHKTPFLASLSLAFLGLAACSHTPPTAQYPADANPAEEIRKLDREMSTLSSQGGDVLAPDRYAKAREYLDEAKDAQQDGESPSEIMKELGYARAQYDMAVSAGAKSRSAIPEILSARNGAIRAGAPKLYPDDFRSAENDLRDMTNAIADGKTASAEDRAEIQKKFLDVELASIKKNRLGDTEAKFEKAKDMKAEKYAPSTFEQAKSSLNNANATIAADRSNEEKISAAVNKANSDVTFLHDVTQVVDESDGETTEASAIAIVNQRRQLAQQSEALRMSQSARENLADEVRADKLLTDAQKMFDSDEAEVFRQGDDLIVRMKNMNFAVGKANLTSSAKASLDKVKNVVEMLGAERLIVEGHTDSTGGKAANQRVAQARANAVKTYLVTDSNIDSSMIETKGVGEESPLAVNTTKEGRAQNRRVDIIILSRQK